MKKKGECPGEHTRWLIRRGLRRCALHDQIRFLPQLLMFNYKSCLYHYWNKTESNINFFEPFFCGARHFQDWTFVVFGVVDKYNCSRGRRLLVVCS